MGGVKGPQAWGLLVLGVLLACGHLIHGSEYYGSYGDGYSVRCTIGIKITTRPPSDYFDACTVLKKGFSYNSVAGCKVITQNTQEQNYYTLYEAVINLQSSGDSYSTQDYLMGSWDVGNADSAAYGGQFVPGTLQCYDLDECVDKTNECSPNAACYNKWASYDCSCLDGYKDYSTSGGRRGYRCDKEVGKPVEQLDIQIWVYVLIGVAIFVVLMLLVCCCCCYSGSSDCCPSMRQAPTKVIKHIKIIPQPMPMQAPCPPPPCICKPPEEKKIIIQVDQAPQAAPAPAPQVIQPMLSGPSAFIANSGYDGLVYTASPQAQPVQATRALPWADGSSMQTVNPPVQYIQQEPQAQQMYQYIQQGQIQQPQTISFEQQPQYDQPITTPYVYNVDVDPSTYYQ